MVDVSTVIPSVGPKDLFSSTILIDNTPLPGKYGVTSVWVLNTINKIPTAKIVLIDGDVSEQDFDISSSDLFNPGKTVEIKVGYNQFEQSIFKGIIIKQRAKLLNDGTTQLFVELKDTAVKTTVGRKNKYYFNQTDTDIIKSIAKRYQGKDVSFEVNEVQNQNQVATHDEMVQYFCTDWDFIISRAEATGRLVFVENGTITVQEPNFNENKLINVSYGNNVYSFDIEIDARDEYKEVIARSWDNNSREIKSKEAKSTISTVQGDLTIDQLSDVIGLDNFPLQHSGKLSEQELQAWANSKLMRSRLAKIKGSAKIDGFNEIKVGNIIGIENISNKFNGNAFVTGVMNQYTSDSGWFTDIQFGFDQKWFAEQYDDIVEKPASGLLPSLNGLVTGIVIDIDAENENEGDPQNNFRVKVKLPLIDDGEEGIWARLATIGAGQERGIFFRPEVGDEVVMGFIDDDPRQPVILGSLYSQNEKGAPPENTTADADNYIKGIFSRNNLKLTFNDEDNSIVLETPKEQKIVIQDDQNDNDAFISIEDLHENKIVMNSNGIEISSGKDLKINAKGNINIDGNNVSTNAKKSYSAEGNSGVKINSKAVTEIKGTTVNIN